MISNGKIIEGQYQVIREIGAGGMGVIYLAYHLRLQKYVVFKKIKNPGISIEAARGEADLLKNLRHTNIPQVFNFLKIGQDIYTIMDYIEGYDLEWYIKNNYPFTVDLVERWFGQMVDVLVYLHKQTPPIIHFDIKPANIIINQNQDAILIDFNISFEGGRASVPAYTQAYASPEQIQYAQMLSNHMNPGFLMDVRTDIYSLCAAFYHMMTNIEPYHGVLDIYPLTDFELPYSIAFCKVIQKGMQINREDRYESAEQLKKAFQNRKRNTLKYKLSISGIVLGALLAVIFCIGSFVVIRNKNQEKQKDAYIDAYNEVMDDYEDDLDESQLENALDILNSSQYKKYLEENKEQNGMLLYIIADAYLAKENYSSAVEYYEAALELCDGEEIYTGYAAALSYTGKYSKAIEVLNETDMSKEDAVFFVARALSDAEDFEGAIEVIKTIEDTNDNSVKEDVLELEIYCYKELGEDNEAEVLYRRLKDIRNE